MKHNGYNSAKWQIVSLLWATKKSSTVRTDFRCIFSIHGLYYSFNSSHLLLLFFSSPLVLALSKMHQWWACVPYHFSIKKKLFTTVLPKWSWSYPSYHLCPCHTTLHTKSLFNAFSIVFSIWHRSDHISSFKLLLNIINLGLQGVSIDCMDALQRHRYLLSSTYKSVLTFHSQNWNTNFLEGLVVQLTTQHGILAYDNCFKKAQTPQMGSRGLFQWL